MGHARRDLEKEAAWRRRLREQGKSGQSVRAWCRRHGVRETAFYWWRKELARRDAERLASGQGDTRKRAASFVPVRVTAEPAWDGDPGNGDRRGGDRGSDRRDGDCGGGDPASEHRRGGDSDNGYRRGPAVIEIVLMDGRRVRLTGPVDGQALATVLDVLTSASSAGSEHSESRRDVLERWSC